MKENHCQVRVLLGKSLAGADWVQGPRVGLDCPPVNFYEECKIVDKPWKLVTGPLGFLWLVEVETNTSDALLNKFRSNKVRWAI